MVTSLHDGMNLVAKEYVAARQDERGVLILSRFTGASRELHDALIVNPYDTEQCANARQLGGEIPPMAIPVVGSDALRTTAQRGEDLVIGRSLHVAAILSQKRKAACVATSGPSLGRKHPNGHLRQQICRIATICTCGAQKQEALPDFFCKIA
jgi:hypothetical protein